MESNATKYKKNNTLMGNTRKHDITFHSNGRIYFSAHIQHLLNLNEGDVIDILSLSNEYYLFVRQRQKDNNGGQHKCRCWKRHKRGASYLGCSSIKICKIMLQISGEESVARFSVGEPQEILHNIIGLPIITSMPISN